MLSLGKCLVGEKSDEIKIGVRNTSRKKREYVIQLDPSFSNPNLRPTFHFSIDETPSAIITQAQEKKLDEELEKLEHKLRIATTKKKSDKITKLNAKIARVKALLSGEQVPSEKTTTKNGDDEEPKSALLADVRAMDAAVYDSCNSESEMSESESMPRSRRRPLQLAKSLSMSETRSNANQLHFSLDAEATCRIVAYAVFTLEQPGSSTKSSSGSSQHLVASQQLAAFKSQKARKRQLRRDSAPIIGVGKFLLFEQQNKDIVKELQYSAEVFLRTDAGEAAYSRVMGRTVPPQGTSSGQSVGRLHAPDVGEWGGGSKDASESQASPLRSERAKLESERSLSIAIPESDRGFESGKILVKVEPSQFAISRSSTLLVPLEESPMDTYGWDVTLSHQSPVLRKVSDVELMWHPTEALQSLLRIVCDVTPPDAVIPGEQNASKPDGESEPAKATSATNSTSHSLPLRVRLAGDRAVTLRFKWCFAAAAGFAPSSSLASCISRSVLAKISKAVEQSAGTLAFVYRGNSSPSSESSGAKAAFASVDVTIVKAVQRSLAVDADKIELGEQQQNTEVQGEFIIRNRSHRQVKYLLLAPSAREHASANASSSLSSSNSVVVAPSGGDLAFEKPNGTIGANSHVVARFTYRGVVPGQHSEQIQLRNLNDRLDTSVLTVAVRVTRPVYVRIPELDPHETGRLEVLDVGPCYVTPEMQDATVDSPNGSLKFSKVHKLTLQNQVDDTLVLCASSNLKTQCYVFEDARLHREATSVVLKGNCAVDLYVAFRPRLSADAFKTGSTRDLVGGIRVQLFRQPNDTLSTVATGDDDANKSEMAAEFTVKFVGVAGASLARVTPTSIDFGVERNLVGRGDARAHAGRFELINVSKALPLHYRLFVTSDSESYSDDDDSLRVALEHDQGEVAPGDTRTVEFTLTAFKSGFFRRRIVVENTHYPGKMSFVDVQLFVDSGVLKCEVFGSSHAAESVGAVEHGHAIDFGVVNVIRLEDELSDAGSMPGGAADSEPASRKYRIFETRQSESTGAALGAPQSRRPLARERFLTLTNTTDAEMVVRPVSTLPLDFVWCGCGTIPPLLHECQHHAGVLMARSTSVDNVRRLLAGTDTTDSLSPRRSQAMYVGEVRRIPPQSSSVLFFRFAPISLTAPLPSDMIETGRLCAFAGVVAIQRFEALAASGETEAVASTLKLVNVSGQYGEPILRVTEKRVVLGKIGYAIGWNSSSFELSVRNTCDVAVCFAVANLPPCLRIRRVRGATPTTIVGEAPLGAASSATSSSSSTFEVPSLRELALHAESRLIEDGAALWRLDAMATCVLEMDFFRTTEVRRDASTFRWLGSSLT